MESWVDIDPKSDFSLANLPFGIVHTPADREPHVAVAVGLQVLDLKVLAAQPGFFDIFPALRDHPDVFAQPTLNAFAALGRPVHREVRATLQGLLRAGDATVHPAFLRDNPELREAALFKLYKTHLPMAIGDYTDFYAGVHHAQAVGALFRDPGKALMPNYGNLPVAYHGRASSVVVSRTGVQRPWGQILAEPSGGEGDKAAGPGPVVATAPTRRLDFELELGCLISLPNQLGSSIPVESAEDHIFGYVLLNDWSARDIQSWEYVPLGPFNGKNFMTTISPWVVLADALEPFRVPALQPSEPLQPYLDQPGGATVFDMGLSVDLTTPEGDVTTITRVSSRNLQWSFSQMIAHHTLGGCPLRTGDLLGTGTISGPKGGSESGSLLEMNQGGKKDVMLYGMDMRTYLKDGDTITLRGSASVGGTNGGRVGFGECIGQVFSAVTRKT